MKICIPTADDRGLDAALAQHFGQAPFLTMVDVDSGDLKVVRNPGCHSKSYQCHHVPLLTAHGVDAVACLRLGKRAQTSLRASGIEVLAVPGDMAVGAIAALSKAGELLPAQLGGCRGHHAEGHGGGHHCHHHS